MLSHIDPPSAIRELLAGARKRRGWSQSKLGESVGLPQAHVSAIESGKVVPRLDTMLEIARVLDHDLILVPRELVPVVQSLIQDYRAADAAAEEDRPLYQPDEPS
ncbi:MAG TPA: helix-turn-helix transcriptional regulator [Bryobacteraceae bacterium]|nr:helix-turn-helix transcriptional regulator [Bryobacteraceae bacterium]